MKLARTLSLSMLALGAVLLTVGVACSGNDEKQTVATVAPTETSTSTPSPTATPTVRPIPTATPTPFNGKVARFKYSRFGIDAPVDALATNAAGELDTPHAGRENTAVAWYDQDLEKQYGIGSRPGWGGNAVFSAHVFYISSSACPNNPRSCPGPFQKLAQAKEGDELSVVMENGVEYKYKVISNKQYTVAVANTIMGQIISPPEKPEGKEWITMITCGGSLDASGLEYVSRDVVVAERIS